MIITRLDPAPEPGGPAGLGALRTDRGNLPLHRIDVRATITGLAAGVAVTQGFRNTHDVPLEATYVFPLPERAALTSMTMTAGDRVVAGVLRERGEARQTYERAVQAGQRAGIAEEERPDVFTLRVGNILPGEDVTVELTLAQPLPVVDGTAEFRFPLVVAPRYIPGVPLPGDAVGDGYALDTDAVPDASRITPPVLLPGFPNPVALSIEVRLDPAGLPLVGVASSLHAVTETEGVLAIRPGERVDRDFILRLSYGQEAGADSLLLAPDDSGAEGTYQLTVLPPRVSGAAHPRDVVLLLDRSGSMGGWKMVAARRAAARIIDTLTGADRFAVLTFDHEVQRPDGLPDGLAPATDRLRYRAVEHLARTQARGGTELLAPLRRALEILGDEPVPGEPAGGAGSVAPGALRDRVLVLVTDGQVGNEDQILRGTAGGLRGVRVHAIGIDRAVNAGFLGRLASVGGGRCELVESEDRLDEAMDRIHRRIGAPLVTDIVLSFDGVESLAGTATPARTPHLFPGVPLVVSGRYRGSTAGGITLTGTTADGEPWRRTIAGTVLANSAAAAVWARGHLRDLEDRYAVAGGAALEQEIVATSLRFGVLCRFTAYVAVDPRPATAGGRPHGVTQPVELPAGWEMPELTAMAAPLSVAAPGGAPPAPAPVSLGFRSRAATGAGPAAAGRAFAMAAPPGLGEAALPPTGPGGSEPGAGPLAAEIAAEEVRRLREAAGEPLARRAELLDDLASRLDALAGYLTAEAGGPHTQELRALVTLLRDAAVPLEKRWAAALELLERLAGGRPVPPGREEFWKR